MGDYIRLQEVLRLPTSLDNLSMTAYGPGGISNTPSAGSRMAPPHKMYLRSEALKLTVQNGRLKIIFACCNGGWAYKQFL